MSMSITKTPTTLQCQKCKNFEEFHASVKEYHTWLVDGSGDFIEDIGCNETGGLDSEAFQCAKCSSMLVERVPLAQAEMESDSKKKVEVVEALLACFFDMYDLESVPNDWIDKYYEYGSILQLFPDLSDKMKEALMNKMKQANHE